MPITTSEPRPSLSRALSDDLRHVRWLAGGTGSGKSTVASLLADRYDVAVLNGDRAEHGWLGRCTPEGHPRLSAAVGRRPGDAWRGRTAAHALEEMASWHGETVGLLVEDLLAMPRDRVVIVDYFGVLPRDLAPLLSWGAQAAFLIPTAGFRRDALTARYADPSRARANWGDLDPADVLELRLGRDALWDHEVRTQAEALGLSTMTIDGTRSAKQVSEVVAVAFGLGEAHT